MPASLSSSRLPKRPRLTRSASRVPATPITMTSAVATATFTQNSQM